MEQINDKGMVNDARETQNLLLFELMDPSKYFTTKLQTSSCKLWFSIFENDFCILELLWKAL